MAADNSHDCRRGLDQARSPASAATAADHRQNPARMRDSGAHHDTVSLLPPAETQAFSLITKVKMSPFLPDEKSKKSFATTLLALRITVRARRVCFCGTLQFLTKRSHPIDIGATHGKGK
jgi:hypothetical protein